MALGKIVCDLAPTAENPRNSEGAFVTGENGDIDFYYSRYTGKGPKDDAEAEISRITSRDGGESWSEPVTIDRPENYNALNLMSVSIVRMDESNALMFYVVRYGWHDCRLHMRKSADDGKSWSDAVRCIPSPGYYVVNNDRVIRLRSGRLIIPSSYHKMKGESRTEWSSFDSRGTAYFFYSDDEGKTWNESDMFFTLSNPHSKSGLQEPGVIELESGILWAWFRTDLGRQYESFSRDSGKTWAEPKPSFFTGPCSPLSVKRIPRMDSLVAVWNPVPNYNGREAAEIQGGRTPLVLALSRDEGAEWTEPHIVENDKDRGYCYTAIHHTEKALLISYCAGSLKDGSCLSRTRIRKIPFKDIL